MPEEKYDLLYNPDVDPRHKYHRCSAPLRGKPGSIVGCKDCGQLWYFRFRRDRWYRGESLKFIKVRWYHFGLRRLL